MVPNVSPAPNGMVMKILPGADRKRSPGLYCFRVTYRNPGILAKMAATLDPKHACKHVTGLLECLPLAA